ncbi:MAG: 30S ribosomal protein S6 [Chloroflexota bacterium]
MVTEKATEAGLRSYELTVILKPEATEETEKAILENISKLVTAKGGTAPEVTRWGKRRLAYPIKHSTEGIYILMRFQGKPALSRELEANLRISEEILRHLLVKVE